MRKGIKSETEIQLLREGGKRLAACLHVVASRVEAGVTTRELDTLARTTILAGGDEPAFLGYKPLGASYPYPATLCVSVNDEVVHGIPGKRVLAEGDIVGLDLGLAHKGLFTDMAVTVPVGKIRKGDEELIRVTKEALLTGIAAARAGNHIGAIGSAIEQFVKPFGYGIVRELGGHGVGYEVHEEPHIPNFGRPDEGVVIEEGMVLAIEPMLIAGKRDVVLAPDGYTYSTKDGSHSAHFEHTIVVIKDGAVILTEQV